LANDTFNPTIGDSIGLTDDGLQTNCTTYNMTDAPSLSRHFGYHVQNDSSLIPETVYEVFNFRKFAQRYDGTEIVNGLACDKYTSCQYSEQFQANATVTHYFTSKKINSTHLY
jgi:hypothetical protein